MNSRRREKPSLDGVIAKIERAAFHFEDFERAWARTEEANTYTFVGKVSANGAKHVYFADEAPALDSWFSLTLGDCVHNLRSALDHLAWQLARGPSRRTQFPILDRRPQRWTCRGRRPGAIRVAGDLPLDALRIIEEVQPYNGTNAGRDLLTIQELDAIDKHRHLFLAAAAVDFGISVYDPFGPEPPEPDPIKMWTCRPRSFVPGQPALVLTYDPPNAKINPHFKPALGIAFGEGRWRFEGRPIRNTIGPLPGFLRDELLPRFAQFF